MLLVMNTTSLFDPDQPLTLITIDRIRSFLPGLWEEVFKPSTPPPVPSSTTEVLLLKSVMADAKTRLFLLQGPSRVSTGRRRNDSSQ